MDLLKKSKPTPCIDCDETYSQLSKHLSAWLFSTLICLIIGLFISWMWRMSFIAVIFRRLYTYTSHPFFMTILFRIIYVYFNGLCMALSKHLELGTTVLRRLSPYLASLILTLILHHLFTVMVLIQPIYCFMWMILFCPLHPLSFCNK